jgi:hypothetical protein
VRTAAGKNPPSVDFFTQARKKAKAKAARDEAAKEKAKEKAAKEKAAKPKLKPKPKAVEMEEDGMGDNGVVSSSEEEEEVEATGSTSRMASRRKTVPQRTPSRDPPPRKPPPGDPPRRNTSRDENPHSPASSRCTLPDTPPSLAMLKRQLQGMQRAQHMLDAPGLMRLGELEFDIKEREKKRCRYKQ